MKDSIESSNLSLVGILVRRIKLVSIILGILFILFIVGFILAPSEYIAKVTVQLPKDLGGNFILNQYDTYLLLKELGESVKLIDNSSNSKLISLKCFEKYSYGLISFEPEVPSKESGLVAVTLKMRDPAVLYPVSECILSYLNDVNLIKRKLQLEKAKLKIEIRKYQVMVKELKDINKNFFDKLEKKEFSFLGFNPQLLKINVIKNQEELEKKRELLKEIKGYMYAVEPKNIPVKSTKLKWLIYAVIGLIASIFLMLFIVVFIESIRHIEYRK